MKLIVGLGNPGYEYYLTPHNIGFMAVDRLAEICGVDISRRQSQALVAETEFEGQPVVLAKPQTFVNLSGLAVARLLDVRRLAENDLVVLLDDVNLPLGMLRIRARGSAGGHNGLKSIIGALGSDGFLRIRMGVGPNPPLHDLASYVLTPFRERDLEAVAECVDHGVDAVRALLKEGPQRAMTQFNRRVLPQES